LEAGNFDEVTLFLKTPGIPCSAIGFVPKEKLTSQSDIFLRLFANQVVAISGTKGKSTTSSLLYKIIKDQNPNVVFAGNIGLPLFEVLDEINEETIIVVEMSAHQLQFIEKSPHISVLLNLYEEHLDHFEDCSEYWNAKFNLALHQSKGDFFVYNSEDERIESLLRENELKSECIAFSKEEYDYDEPMYLKGEHNKLNALAALKVAEILGLNKEKAVESLMGFEPLQHRLQLVSTINGVTYYNDSISTIPEATIAALEALKKVQTLILGGKDRGIDYSVLIKGLSKYSVENIAFVGQAGKRMNQMLKDAGFKYNCLESNNYEEIVKWCAEKTQKGKICLLSPAASSYDMFRNFEHRGEVFSTLVKALRNI
jgi:UDP-N-acetylmuramoylalanine--D-glutamate ligase